MVDIRDEVITVDIIHAKRRVARSVAASYRGGHLPTTGLPVVGATVGGNVVV